MAELTPLEKLQPCLLDRLTDDNPGKPRESRDERVMSLRRYREAVRRDLSWLMNAASRPPGDIIYDYEEVAHSVLNYGIRDLSGLTAEGVESGKLEREIREAIARFEPRVLAEGLSVTATIARGKMDRTALSFEIRGQLWAQPVAEQLFLKTEVDLETGTCEVHEGGNG